MHALEIDNLRKVYGKRLTALRGIDLRVQAGDFFALLGPNGAGKSTTIGIIASLVTKSAGRVRVFGHDLDREVEQARAAIGLVPQEVNFSQFEPVEDICVNQAGYYGIPRPRARERAREVLGRLGLWGRRRDPARSLSGGLKRRLLIARALLHEPRLLILDEPTAGVDIETRRSMWAFLQQINAAGTTIILTTHYLEEAENLCRNIAIIDDGRIIENTRMRDLLDKLSIETFVLDLAGSADALPELRGFAVRQLDERSIEVDVRKETGLNDLFRQLDAAGQRVLSMRNKANRLEELFLRLLEDNGGAAPAGAETETA